VSHIDDAFAQVRAQDRKALVVYLCAGDPSLEATASLVPELAEAGADVIELGVPFSDPLADGPTIQAASQRALERGVTLRKVLSLARRLRDEGSTAPLVLMGYMNPIVSMGVERFCESAQAAGVDGLIVPDLPIDEAEELSRAAKSRALDLILLAAPTTPAARLAKIGARTAGFLYFVSVTGVTGARAQLPEELPSQLAGARASSKKPVVVGFGVSTPEQARALSAHADGVVVGSAIVQKVAAGPEGAKAAVTLVRSLRAALVSSGDSG
jgi:tryptophan synthase alpha chain